MRSPDTFAESAYRWATRESTIDAFEWLILALIVANTGAVVLGTVDPLARRYGTTFTAIEDVTVAVFTVEFAIRVATRLLRPTGDGRGRLRRLFDVHLLIDLLAILPVYVGVATGTERFGSSSMFRVLRLFKLVRYVHGIEILLTVVRRKRADLAASVFWTGLLWLLAASSMYFAESGAQPEAFSSIPKALWWAGITITTVGYGDVYPVTPLGQVLGMVASLLGIGVAAVPSSILVSGFLEETGPERNRCPHCGEQLDE